MDAKVINSAAIINMVKLTFGKTFCDNAINTFVPYISSLLSLVKRVDLVWERYFAETLNNCAREKMRSWDP